MTVLRRYRFRLVAVLALVFISLFIISATTALAAPPTQNPTPAPTPLPVFALSDDSGKATNQRLLFDRQGNLHVIWDDSSARSQGVDVYHRQRSPEGHWSNTENLTEGLTQVFEDSNRILLNPEGNVCVFYNAELSDADPGGLGIYMRCQENGAWSQPKLITLTPGTHRADDPVFAPDGTVKTLYLTGAGDLYFQDVKLSDDQAAAYQPAFIADSNGGYHAIWTRQGDVFTLVHRYSSDGGATWSPPETLNPPDSPSGSALGIAADNQGRVHLAWESLGSDIFYQRWDRATGWTAPVNLRQDAASNNSTTFGIAVAPTGLAAVTWLGINELIYTEQRADNTFTVPTGLAPAQSSGPAPQIIIDAAGTRQFVYQLLNPDPQLFFATMASLVSAPSITATPTGTSYNSPFFQNHIHDPSILFSASPATLATNFLFALILALAMGFFGNLLNDTLEANEDRVAAMLGPLNRFVGTARTKTGAAQTTLNRRHLGWLGTLVQVIVLLVLLGVIYSFVDPAFSPTNPDALLAILALTLSVGVIGLVDDLAQYAFLRRNGQTAALRVHSGNAVIALFSALGSRVFRVTPGILIGSPAGIEDVRAADLEAALHLIALGAIAVISLIAWFLAPLFTASLYLVTILLLIFGVGIQTLFFEMLPLRDLHGKGIFQYNRILWLIMVALIGWLFLTTMLNPDGEFLSSFNQPNMVTLALVVGAFCLFSAAVWFYFARTAEKSA